MINESILINKNAPLTEALVKLDQNPQMKTLIVIDNNKVVGTVTDGDIRRGLIDGLSKNSAIGDFMLTTFTHLTKDVYDASKIEFIKSRRLKIIPVLNEDGSLFEIYNFNNVKTILPVDAVIMAGGVGSRLMPLTKDTPKPMLKINGKPIMEYNVDLLKSYGIKNLNLSVKYLKEIIEDYYKDGSDRDMNISYITEYQPLGTIGAVKQIKDFKNDYILVMNSDLLTNINLEEMFENLYLNNADMIIATKEYKVEIPFGIVETKGKNVKSLKEKPTYTYSSNAGIYIIKKDMIDLIPSNKKFNATDLLEKGIAMKRKILHYPIKGYWLDIGNPNDFEKAQKDVTNLQF